MLAPFYFHFGHCWFFIESMVVLTNIIDTLGLYFITFMLIVAICIYRNTTFQTFVKNFFRNYSYFFNFLPLSMYSDFFFNLYYDLLATLTTIFFFFFKKRK